MKHIQKNPENQLREKLSHIPAIKNLSLGERDGNILDGTIETQCDNAIRLITVDKGFPKNIERAVLASRDRKGECYCIVIAPYISNSSAELCKKLGAGYLDYSGNCLISMEDIYLSDVGHPNLFPKEDKVKNPFKSSSVVTSRILREMLADTSVRWKIQDLSKKIGCSIGMVSRVKDYLCDQLWGEMGPSGFCVTDAEAILHEWSHSFSHDGINIINTYTSDDIAEAEGKLSDVLKSNSYMGGFTGFSGGVRYAPVVRYTRIHMWIAADHAYDFIKQSGLKEVDSGANVMVYVASGDDVFVDLREKDGIPIVSPVQVYLDLMNLQARGEEMAEAVLKKEVIQ